MWPVNTDFTVYFIYNTCDRIFVNILISGDQILTNAAILISKDVQSINDNLNDLRHVCDNITQKVLEVKSMVNIILVKINNKSFIIKETNADWGITI